MDPGLLYEHVAAMGKAMGSGSRLRLLELLSQGERGVQDLADAAELTLPNTSSHLQALRRVGLVASRRDGTTVLYRLADYSVAEFLVQLREFAVERISDLSREVERRFGEDAPAAMSREELLARLDGGDVLLIDVRPVEEYQSAHIPDAISMPLPELQRRIHELPKEVDIVAYCRGPFCLLSQHAVELLESQGYRASELEDGFPEWRLANLPVASTS